MADYRRLLLLVLIMTGVAIIVGLTALAVFYDAAFERERQRLANFAESQPGHPRPPRPSASRHGAVFSANFTRKRAAGNTCRTGCRTPSAPAGTPPGGAVIGKVGLSTQDICGATRPGAALSHNLPHASGHRIDVDDTLDRGPTVGLVGPCECASGQERVEIGANGWRIADDPPVRFRRSAAMQPLPLPVRGGSIESLAPFLNLAPAIAKTG